MKKPLIGVTSGDRIFFADDYKEGVRVSYTLSTITDAVLQAGGIAVSIPIHDSDHSADFIDQLDGLILSGGSDITPRLYGESLSQKADRIDPLRDEREIALIKAAINKGIPILGICRGMQLMNVVYGGSLYQDLSYNPDITIQHNTLSSPTIIIHDIHVKEGSYFERLIPEETGANSFHHQAIKNLGSGIEAVAWADDGVIEAIESKAYNFVGVQYHPESLVATYPEHMALFEDIIFRAKQFIESKHFKASMVKQS